VCVCLEVEVGSVDEGVEGCEGVGGGGAAGV